MVSAVDPDLLTTLTTPPAKRPYSADALLVVEPLWRHVRHDDTAERAVHQRERDRLKPLPLRHATRVRDELGALAKARRVPDAVDDGCDGPWPGRLGGWRSWST